MIPFWRYLYDHFKDRRYGALFLLTFFLGGGAMLVAAQLWRSWRPEYSRYVWPGLSIFGLALVLSAIRSFRSNRRNCWQRRPLSSDEMRVARSKLLRNRKREGV